MGDPGQRAGLFPCEYVPEVPAPPGAVPHHLPGTNPNLKEYGETSCKRGKYQSLAGRQLMDLLFAGSIA